MFALHKTLNPVLWLPVIRPLATGSLVAMLSLGGAIAGILSTPEVAQADLHYVTLFVPRAPGEDYNAFLAKVRAIAQAGVQYTFDADPLTSNVAAKVVGDNQGISIPIMAVEVSRAQWQQRPDVDYWGRYYNQTSTLLGL